jgi:protein required for attachment to host cells
MPSRPQKTWIVVADAARARIIAQAARNEQLEVIEERHHAASRRQSHEIGSDSQGRSFDSSGLGGRHSMEPPTDPQEHEKTKFARELAHFLNDAAKAQRFDRLAIACPAQMLGDLRRDLDKAASAKVVAELSKDLSGLPLHELPAHFADVVSVPDPREIARRGG